MNRIQFQSGLSLSEFLKHFGTEIQCATALEQTLWPQGLRYPAEREPPKAECTGVPTHCSNARPVAIRLR